MYFSTKNYLKNNHYHTTNHPQLKTDFCKMENYTEHLVCFIFYCGKLRKISSVNQEVKIT